MAYRPVNKNGKRLIRISLDRICVGFGTPLFIIALLQIPWRTRWGVPSGKDWSDYVWMEPLSDALLWFAFGFLIVATAFNGVMYLIQGPEYLGRVKK